MMNYSELENNLGYKFQDATLLTHALTHSSYASEHGLAYVENNERLEFIGDAYLDAIIGNKLYDIMPNQPEGVLSKTRASIVCENSLAMVARRIQLGKYLRLGNGEEMHGGSDKDSILADAMEAIIGAIIIEDGYETGDQVVLSLFKENILMALQGKLHHDYKSALQEMLQGKHKSVQIQYELISESGPDHRKNFSVQVCANGKVLGQGSGHSKKAAEQEAARSVLTKGV